MKNTDGNFYGRILTAAVLMTTVLTLTGWLVFKESASAKREPAV